ncbi:MAG: hypothetical protein QNK30_17320 [Bacteroidales bacterium]|nr:hypothetical protein [Bacteroidales bacterium]
MARLPRLSLPGIPQHIIQRGNNHQVCFFSDDDYAHCHLTSWVIYSITPVNGA